MMLADNLKQVQQSIQKACDQVGRSCSEVTLVAVTKTEDVPTTQAMIALGQLHLAENRADKFLAKKQAITHPEVVWHYIGNLQRRKVKDVINEVDYFHALDSLNYQLTS